MKPPPAPNGPATRITRVELVELIEVTIAELKTMAQPHEIATFRELGYDAEEAETPEQLEAIEEQVQSLRSFCERRARSAISMPSVPPQGRRRE